MTESGVGAFLGGATALGCLIIALFFLRFWRQTRDRLFAIFSLAFFVFAMNRVLLTLVLDVENEARTFVYLLRLGAFVLIIAAVVDKNRGNPRRT